MQAKNLAAKGPSRQIRFSRIVDLTVPIESNMPGIPGVPAYEKNPSKVDVIGIMNEAQRQLVTREGMTLRDDVMVTGRSMISILSILVHNGTHVDAPRHMIEQGEPIDRVPLEQLGTRSRRAPSCRPTCATSCACREPRRVECAIGHQEGGLTCRRTRWRLS